MKHAFLITAYKSAPLLLQLVRQLNHPDASFFIHIDKKGDILKDRSIQSLKSFPRTFIDSSINVYYGGFSHLQAIVKLVKIALEESDATYFHTLSGQCFPLQPTEAIFNFFDLNNGRNYMEMFTIPDMQWLPTENGGWDRIKHYYLQDILDPKGRLYNFLNPYVISLQRKFKFQRAYSDRFPPPYAGSVWWSLHRSFLEYFIDYIETHGDFYNRFRNSFCSEEFLFQTVIMNSPFKDTVINNNVRYIDWSVYQSSPATLNEKFYDDMMNSNHLFARKFEQGYSDRLLARVITAIKEKRAAMQ